MSNKTDNDVISFKDRATADQAKPRNDLLVIELTIKDIDVAGVLVNTVSSSVIIYKKTLERMNIELSEITEILSPLVGFSREATMTLGLINLTFKARSKTKNVDFWSSIAMRHTV